MTPNPVTICENCEKNPAVLHCEECCFSLCESCEKEIHKPRLFKTHTRKPITVSSCDENADDCGDTCDSCDIVQSTSVIVCDLVDDSSPVIPKYTRETLARKKG